MNCVMHDKLMNEMGRKRAGQREFGNRDWGERDTCNYRNQNRLQREISI